MSVTFAGTSSIATGSGVSSLTISRSSTTHADLLLLVFGFEGVAAGSGPWVVDSSAGGDNIGTVEGWKRICHQAPSATGSGLEVWAATNNGTADVVANFSSSVTVIAQMFSWSGEYETTNHITDGAVRASATRQVTGDNPEAPSIYSFFGELVIVCAAEEMQSPGFGTPTPAAWTKRDDRARSAFGNVEITVADKQTTVEGDTGLIPWAATAETGSTKGATATLAIRPTAPPPVATSPLIIVEYPAATS